ncbi:MAG: hypothetical protein FWC32_08330 [Firmicutes bacterium]|nr:hypothetical protein [Bacillota bacterium]
MRRQIPFKASIRQPIRTFIFMLLVGLASFGFVSRSVEYIVLSREMNRIERFYRTIGTLVPIDPLTHNNVYAAAQHISGSRFIEFEDRRTITQGVMDGIHNVMHNFHTMGGHPFQRGEQPFSYKGLYLFDTIMTVEVERVFTRMVVRPGETAISETRTMTVRPREILFGYHQFNTVGGRQYQAEFNIDEHGNAAVDHLEPGDTLLVRAIRHCSDPTSLMIDFFPLYDDVYFVNVRDADAFAAAWAAMASDIAVLEENTQMLMLTGTRDMTALPLVQSGVYQRFQGRFLNLDDYLNANPVMVVPQRMDSTRPEVRVGQTITLTLRDMRTFDSGASMTPEIRQFARDMNHLVSNWRGMGPPPPHTVGWAIPEGAEAHWANMPAGYWVSIPRNYEGNWREYPTVTIDVEIVGTYHISPVWRLPRWQHISYNFQNMEVFVPASIIPEGWGIADAHIVSGAYSFVLASPDYITPFLDAHQGELEGMGFAVQFMGPDATNFLLSATPIRNSIRLNLMLFSAVLVVVTMLTVFLYLRQRYKEFAILRALGISQNYSTWQVMVPVFVFWLPIVIAASIGAWFFALNQAAVGLRELAEIATPLDYGEPRVVRNILEQMRFDEEAATMRVTPQLSLTYLIGICAVLIAAWAATVFAGTISFARRSMISLLQGVQGDGAPARAIKETAPSTTGVKIENINIALAMNLRRKRSDAIRYDATYHLRHVVRSPVKSLLVVSMALLFVVSLGWLNTTIRFTEGEIERLYATTVITGQVVNPAVGLDAAVSGHRIPWSSVERLIESGFVTDVYRTAFSRQGLFPSIPESFVNWENTREISTGNCCCFVGVAVKTISDWCVFVTEARRPVEFGLSFGGDFAYTFAEGFGPEDFVAPPRYRVEFFSFYDYYDRDTLVQVFVITAPDGTQRTILAEDAEGELPEFKPIPVIIHESLMTRYLILDNTRWNQNDGTTVALADRANATFHMLDSDGNPIQQHLSLGDYAYLSGQWRSLPVIIIGTYSGGHPIIAYRTGQGLVLVPTGVYWEPQGWIGMGGATYNLTESYNALMATVTFALNQDQVKYVREIENDLNERLSYNIHWEWFCHARNITIHESTLISHTVELNDEEFRQVIMPLEESLHLLRILYPVAIVTSFVLALGLGLLLMLQNVKNVAILRVLGSPKRKTRINLFMEQIAVCLSGLVPGFVVILIMGAGFGTAGILAGIYLAGAVTGTVTGVVIISRKTPLELLQVRE